MLTASRMPRMVLRRHNGADTLYIDDHDERLTLGWMLIGHTEDFAVLLEAGIDWADAERFSSDPQIDPALVLAAHAGKHATMSLLTPTGGGRMAGPLPERVSAAWALQVVQQVLDQGGAPHAWNQREDMTVSAAEAQAVAEYPVPA